MCRNQTHVLGMCSSKKLYQFGIQIQVFLEGGRDFNVIWLHYVCRFFWKAGGAVFWSYCTKIAVELLVPVLKQPPNFKWIRSKGLIFWAPEQGAPSHPPLLAMGKDSKAKNSQRHESKQSNPWPKDFQNRQNQQAQRTKAESGDPSRTVGQCGKPNTTWESNLRIKLENHLSQTK